MQFSQQQKKLQKRVNVTCDKPAHRQQTSGPASYVVIFIPRISITLGPKGKTRHGRPAADVMRSNTNEQTKFTYEMMQTDLRQKRLLIFARRRCKHSVFIVVQHAILNAEEQRAANVNSRGMCYQKCEECRQRQL